MLLRDDLVNQYNNANTRTLKVLTIAKATAIYLSAHISLTATVRLFANEERKRLKHLHEIVLTASAQSVVERGAINRLKRALGTTVSGWTVGHQPA